MAAPKVQKLSEILKQLDPAFAPERRLINKQIMQLGEQLPAQEAALKAQQQQEFGQIEERANERGMIFSGIPLAEQAQFTATEFLPALADLRSTITSGQTALQRELAGTRKDQRLEALGIKEKQKQRRFDFDEKQRQRRFDARQKQRQRRFDARQAAKDRALERELAQISAAQSSEPSSQDIFQAATQGVVEGFRVANAIGGDGFSNPETWNAMKQQWLSLGLSSEDFDAQFGHLVNPVHLQRWGQYNVSPSLRKTLTSPDAVFSSRG